MWGGRASVSIKVRCQDFRERGSSPGRVFLRLFSANVGLVSADVKKFPMARGWGLCSGIEQIWEEHVLDGEATLR